VIDLYQIHWPDLTTPVEDSMGAMVQAERQGRSGRSGCRTTTSSGCGGRRGRAGGERPAAVQHRCQRKIEADVLPFLPRARIGVIVYSPLERGLLPERDDGSGVSAGDHRAGAQFSPETGGGCSTRWRSSAMPSGRGELGAV